VPYTRGVEVSRPVARIVAEVERLAEAGVRAVTLIGQNVNAYHGAAETGGSATLADLLYRVARIPGIAQLRYTTSHPNDVDETLIAAHREKPLQGLLVASPANPTGTMMSGDALSQLIAVAQAEGIRVISDEIYHGLDYAFPAETAAAFSENVTVINSFSKYFCMTGWRVGWLLLPPSLVRSVERLQQNLSISVPALSQVAAQAAFDGRDEMDAVKHGYEENRRILTQGLPRAGLDKFLPVDGAFYLYADISRYSDDSFDFASRMLQDAHVAATPGVDFDPVDGRHFIRFSYAGSAAEMRDAVTRIHDWLHR